MYTGQPSRKQNRDFEGSSKLVETARNYGGFATETKGPSGKKVYILLLAPRPAGKARATSIPAAPLRYVRSEQHSQRACGPQPGGARRRAGICDVAAPRRCHHIACVAAPCICPPGARAKMHTLFSDGPLAP